MMKLEELQLSVNSIAEAVMKMQKGKAVLKEWIDQEEAMSLSGLKKSALYELRRANRLTSSKIGRKVFYKKNEFEKMIEEYEKTH